MDFGGDDEVVGLLMLPFDIVAGVAPVAQGVHVAQKQAVLLSRGDGADHAGDEALPAFWGFMIEKNAVAGRVHRHRGS